jgi:ribosome-binding protein aMBF1 (putative translation factor)
MFSLKKGAGLSVEELAARTGHRVKTIRGYERKRCPTSYWKETEALMRRERK